MNRECLEKIIKDHTKWIKGEGGKRANLSNTDLSNANFRNVDLIWSDFSGADLRDANLRDADLRDVDLSDADLNGADLNNANLRDADLRDVDLRGANLRGADISNADLRNVDLSGADLSNAKFLEVRTDIWVIQVHSDSVRIGCQRHRYTKWMGFSDDEISRMDSRALDWWRVYKPVVKTLIKAVKSQK